MFGNNKLNKDIKNKDSEGIGQSKASKNGDNIKKIKKFQSENIKKNVKNVEENITNNKKKDNAFDGNEQKSEKKNADNNIDYRKK